MSVVLSDRHPSLQNVFVRFADTVCVPAIFFSPSFPKM